MSVLPLRARMKNHIIFTSHISGTSLSSFSLTTAQEALAAEPDHYLKVSAMSQLFFVDGLRHIAALFAVIVHDSVNDDVHLRHIARHVWSQSIMPIFTPQNQGETNPIMHHAFHKAAPEEPVLTLKQAFQLLTRLNDTPHLRLPPRRRTDHDAILCRPQAQYR